MQKSLQERNELLAEIAELYYLKGLNQSEIAKSKGIDRSMVSRMLAEARRQNIVEIRINRPLIFNHELEQKLLEIFPLRMTYVLVERGNDQQLLGKLGSVGAMVVKDMLAPGKVLGLSWGTAVSAVVDAVEVDEPVKMSVVQLVGAMGAQNSAYDGHGLVQRLAQKMGSEAYYLNAPFIVDEPEVARALLKNQSIKEAITLGKQCDLAVLGIGSTNPQYSSFYRAGYVPIEELEELRSVGMVGDVCGLHFNLQGETPDLMFHQRIVTIRAEDLKKIPFRIGVAGGRGKVEAVLGSLRAGFINALVIDDLAAVDLLRFI